MTLESSGLRVGDIVTFASDQESTGGIIFEITENCDPVKPHAMIPRPPHGWSHDPVDASGKRIPAMCINGYIRLKPLYAFFPTELGAKPKGKGMTILLHHNRLNRVKKVDLIVLGTRYMELGNLIRDLAITHGMEIPREEEREAASSRSTEV